MSEKSSSKNGAAKAPLEKPKLAKPKPPVPDAPLCAANNGYWQKKIGGKIHYFGRWGRVVNGSMTRLPGDGWSEALALYNASRETGFTERPDKPNGDLTVADLCNQFRTAMLRRLNAKRKMSPVMYRDYVATTDRLVKKFGSLRKVANLRPANFADLGCDLAEGIGKVRLGNEIQKVRTIFTYAYDNDLIDKPMKFGSEFKKPDKEELKIERNGKPKKKFEAWEIRALIDAAEPRLRAMILLGINCGFGNNDCACLPLSALDGEWHTFPRPKNGNERRCHLWKETRDALAKVKASRPTAKNEADNDLAFLTKYGHRWVRVTGKKYAGVDGIYRAFNKLCKKLGLKQNGERKGVAFYALRHTFYTVAAKMPDKYAAAYKLIVGHSCKDSEEAMHEQYNEDRPDDSRLKAVTDYVHDWLFPAAPAPAAT